MTEYVNIWADEGLIRGLSGTTYAEKVEPVFGRMRWSRTNQWFEFDRSRAGDLQALLQANNINYKPRDGMPGPLTPQQQDLAVPDSDGPDLTHEEALLYLNKMTAANYRMQDDAQEFLDSMAVLYRRRGWIALGIPSWDVLCEMYVRDRMNPQQRQTIAMFFRAEGMSMRSIAAALGVSHPTIRKDLDAAETAAGGNYLPPERSEGPDGKSYPARRPAYRPPPVEEEVIEGEVMEDDNVVRMPERREPVQETLCGDEQMVAVIEVLERGAWVSEPYRLRVLRLLELVGQRNDLSYTT